MLEKGIYNKNKFPFRFVSVSYTHLRAHETSLHLVCRLLLEKNSKKCLPKKIILKSKKTNCKFHLFSCAIAKRAITRETRHLNSTIRHLNLYIISIKNFKNSPKKK